MCGRLGIREIFSQAYYPQANGRAEVACQQLIGILRKLHAEEEINWLEALPQALLYLHDRVGEGGLSPYKILMGRERPLAGIPYTPERECIEAQNYFDQISEIDQLVADNLDGKHLMAQHRHNSRIKGRPDFRVGDLV